MTELLEITGEDIAKLNDGDLRNLVGLLCEADYRSEGHSAKGITWGGNQDAADGGLDVMVRHDLAPPANSFIPKKITGFQVKKSDMPASAITKEMMPHGKLRDEIKSIITNNGSYIIVSSGGSTTESALNKRLEAMKNTIATEVKKGTPRVEFMDRGKVASWVRFHPSYIFWVRNKIGKPIKGWQPYGNWSHSPNGLEDEYLIDEGLRIYDGLKDSKSSISVEEGLLNLRKNLSVHGSSVRLTGLSGVGKTRLVQALFDDRIGKKSLDPSRAIYTDISDGPSPDPKSMAEQLIAEKAQGILIVDNCPPDLHRRLAAVCSKSSSTIALLTIEYDVRDDLPEETSVYRLEPASEAIVEELIKRRYSHISTMDSRSIAEFSGGNSRVAIALANTLNKGETLSGFKDEQLFERLFRQRHDSNSDLLMSAEVCSLVYSFEGTDVESEDSELNILASLIEKTGGNLYREVSTLKSRNLIQSRNVWRAVLPHAIANRLAKRALDSLPKNKITTTFQNAPERLLRSFTNRLGYLHDCPMAIEITHVWMGKSGLLGRKKGQFDSLGISMFRNLAPVSPKAALLLIENASNEPEGKDFTSRKNSYYYEFVRVLKNIAYDPLLFQRSTRLICRFALAESVDERTNSTRDILKSLFYLQLSGTHAPIEDRIKIIEELVKSSNQDEIELGILLLDAALEAWHFSSAGYFNFGARPRDYGFEPKTYGEVKNWFDKVIDVVHRLSLSKKGIADKARFILAGKLRGLTSHAGMIDKLEGIIREIHSDRVWQDGWFAIKSVLRFDKDQLEKETLDRIFELENQLKPKNILELARAYAVSKQHGFFSLEDDYDEDEDLTTVMDRVRDKTIELGFELANDWDALGILIPELLSTANMRVYQFGQGLAKGCDDKSKLWYSLRDHLRLISEDKQNLRVMLGFLDSCSKIDVEFYNATLDKICSADEFLVQWFPWFQITSNLDSIGIKRLNISLDNDNVRIFTYGNLAYGRTHEDIEDDDLANLLKKISLKEGGEPVALDILQMRFLRSEEKEKKHSKALIKVAFEILADYPFGQTYNGHFNFDHSMADIAKICLLNEYGLNSSHSICENVSDAIAKYKIYDHNCHMLLESLALGQPLIFLDNFIGEKVPKDNYGHTRSLLRNTDRLTNPLNKISTKDILIWADIDSNTRYPIVSSSISAFEQNSTTGKLEWRPIIYELLERAPSLPSILENIRRKIYPSSWSGSLANILDKRLVLFSNLLDHHNSEVRDWAEKAHSELLLEIPKRREDERLRNVHRNESFE